MKHTLQKIAILMAVSLSAFFFGCQKEDIIIPEQSAKQGIRISTITFEQFKTHQKAFNEFETLNNKELTPKSREYGDDYYYQTEEVTLLEYSDSRYSYKSYIFPIYRDAPGKNIENLVIWEKSTGETNSYIFTYYLDESDIESVLDGKQIFLGDKTLIRNVAKTDPDPYVVQAADGRCGVYSGTEPNDTSFFTQVYDGVTVYFDVVPCDQYEIDLSYVQDGGNDNGGGGNNSGGGGDNSGGTGNTRPSIMVGYFQSGGSGNGGNPGGPNPGGSGTPGEYSNPVLGTPIINQLWQGFVNSLSDEELDFLFSEGQLKFGLRDLISQSQPGRFICEKIFDFAMDGHLDEALSILEYLNDGTSVSEVDIDYINEIIDIVNNETLAEDYDSDIFNITMEALKGDYLAQPFDADYYDAIDPYTAEDLQANWPAWEAYFRVQCAIIRSQHPEYSTLMVYYEATKEMVHIALDIVGLVPAFGEVADLANGIIYTIEGDGVNASLSFAATVPVAGWAATGTKYARKVVQITATTKTTLHWSKISTNITFGKSAQLRKVLNLTSPSMQAHHIIPWGKSNHDMVQIAASKRIDAFHMNEALNGIPLNKSTHLGSHSNYDNRIVQKMDAFMVQHPNATPEQCYNGLLNIIQDVRIAIQNNPTTHINQLIF